MVAKSLVSCISKARANLENLMSSSILKIHNYNTVTKTIKCHVNRVILPLLQKMQYCYHVITFSSGAVVDSGSKIINKSMLKWNSKGKSNSTIFAI